MMIWHILFRAAVVVATLTVASCGGSGDRVTDPTSLDGAVPPAKLKRIVIGTPEHRQTLRESLRRPTKPLPPTLSLRQSKNGGPIASDAPNPYIESAGMVLAHAQSNGTLQVAYHEDRAGRIARDASSRTRSTVKSGIPRMSETRPIRKTNWASSQVIIRSIASVIGSLTSCSTFRRGVKPSSTSASPSRMPG